MGVSCKAGASDGAWRSELEFWGFAISYEPMQRWDYGAKPVVLTELRCRPQSHKLKCGPGRKKTSTIVLIG
jgi:hypothetical protein